MSLRPEMKVLDRVFDPPGANNADGIAVGGDSVFVLDGASSLRNEMRGNQPSSAWLTANLVDHLKEFSAGNNLLSMLEEKLTMLSAEYASGEQDGSSNDCPFTCMIGLLAHFDVIELISWGDCQGLIYDVARDTVERFGYCSVAALDADVTNHVQDLKRGKHMDQLEAFSEVRGKIERNREQRNKMCGYQILDLKIPRVGRPERRFMSIDKQYEILLASDGLMRAVDLYAMHSDDSIIRFVKENGLKKLVMEVRAIEKNDTACERFPRLKPSDDIAAVLVEFDGRSLRHSGHSS